MQFELQPHLKGKLIEVRPLEPDDFDALFAAASDPLIWEQHPEPDRYTRPVFQKFFDGAIDSRGGLAVLDRKSGRIIGSSRYFNLKPKSKSEPSEIEIGFTFLERAYWGGEYNGELKRLMVEHALKFVERVVFVVGERNLRSQKALEKIGARYLRKAELPGPDGTLKPNVIFAISRPKKNANRRGRRER